jgi:cyclopropane fatty-acyl-phospholipid synthase-like methyltransferase
MHKLFFEIHENLPREGPGRFKYTKKAFELIPNLKNPKILDIGCGPGDQTIHVAKLSDGEVIGIDNHQPYLDVLSEKIKKEKLENKIKAVNKSMLELDYELESFDIIWAEGSIFVIGFEKGLREWKKFIKANGFLAVHEMTWLKDNPPKEIYDYFQKVYPDIITVDENIEIIKKCNYKLLGYFTLPEDAWWELYYHPLEKRLDELRIKYKDDKEALEYLDSEQEEIDLFRKYYQWYGSVFYVMQKNEKN